MPIDVTCPQCARAYRLADSAAGKRIRCKQCQCVIGVPGGVAAPDQPAVAQHALSRSAQPLALQPPPQTAGPRPPQALGAPFGMVPQAAVLTRGINVVFVIGAVLMLFGFMTPWISYKDMISISGFQIPILINKFAASLGDESRKFAVLYFMYFIPVAALGALVDEFFAAKRGKNRWYVRLIAAFSPLIAFLLIVATFPTPDAPPEDQPQRQERAARPGTPTLLDFIGFGAWLSLGGFAVSLGGVFTSPKPRPVTPFAPPRPRRALGLANAAPRPRFPAGPKLPGPAKPPARKIMPRRGSDDDLSG